MADSLDLAPEWFHVLGGLIGIEKVPKYFDIAARRVERAIKDKAELLPF